MNAQQIEEMFVAASVVAFGALLVFMPARYTRALLPPDSWLDRHRVQVGGFSMLLGLSLVTVQLAAS